MKSIAYPYKFSICHKLNPGDGARCVKFCHWILDFASNENMFNKFYFSNEERFYLNEYINAQNFRTWSAINPHQFMESPLDPQKIGFFCATSGEKIVGPSFFTTAINEDQYKDLMLDFISQLSRNKQKYFFQQDGVCIHTKSTTIDFLGPFFWKMFNWFDFDIWHWEWPRRAQIYYLQIFFFLWTYL